MATLKTIAPATWTIENHHTEKYNYSRLYNRYNTFADSQKNSQAAWFFVVLLVHGVFFLPLPAALMYYFNAPLAVLAVTMITFFANLIATMSGGGIRVTLGFFAASIVINLVMALICIL